MKCESCVFSASLDAPPATAAALDRIAKELVRTIGSFETVIAELESGPLDEITLCGGSAQVESLARIDGEPIEPAEIGAKIRELSSHE